MSKQEIPELTISTGEGSEVKLNPFNSSLFTFVGTTLLENGDYSENSDRNHVYYMYEDDGDMRGAYIFGSENVSNLGGAMLRMNFPALINKWEVPAGDEEAYQTYLSQQTDAEEAGNFVPEGWLSES